MPLASANSIEITYETFGQPGDPGLVLIMGLGEQMVAWPTEFCRRLADTGFYVIRFDNRDTGLSTKFDACGLPNLFEAWDAYFKAAPITPPYSLQDMAADVNGLLESLSIAEAVPNAQYTILADWGHGFDYPELWSSMIEHIVNFRTSHPF